MVIKESSGWTPDRRPSKSRRRVVRRGSWAANKAARRAVAAIGRRLRLDEFMKDGSNNKDGEKPTKLLPVQILHLISEIYESKLKADAVADRTGFDKETFPDFIWGWMVKQYGLKSMARKSLASLVLTVKDMASTNLRVGLFGRVTGIVRPPELAFDPNQGALFCRALSVLFSAEVLRKRLDKAARVDGGTGAVEPMYVEMEKVKASLGALYPLQQTRKEILAQLEALSLPDLDRPGLAGAAKIDVDVFLEVVLDSFHKVAEDIKTKLTELYHKHDDNGDGVLSFWEFTSMVKELDPSTPEKRTMSMFMTALNETQIMAGEGAPETDCLTKDAFLKVAQDLGLMPGQANAKAADLQFQSIKHTPSSKLSKGAGGRKPALASKSTFASIKDV